MKKKIISFVCVLLFVFSFCSCKNNVQETTSSVSDPTEETIKETSEETSQTKSIIIPYTSKAELNPFKTDSQINRYISNLIYDPLFRVNSSYEPVEIIGSSYAVDGNILTVELRDDVVFSNGELIDARDVIYSYQQAKSSPLYSQRLSNFYSCSYDDNSITFNMTTPDIFAVNCLDFPIIKFGSATSKMPVGSGRYVLKKKGGKYFLKENEYYMLDEEMEQERIELLDLSTVENDLYLLQIGELTCSYSDPNGSKPSKIIASKQQISLNNLVYLGINSDNDIFDDINIRNAISLAIDKSLIADNAYDGLARACKSAFNPSWSKALIFESKEEDFDLSKANDLLEKSGYIYAYKSNKFRSKDFKYLTVDLIVNKESPGKVNCANLIEEQLEKSGIDVKLYELDYDSYLNRLACSDYDLYIGEVKLTANMDLSVFFSDEACAGYGIDKKSAVCSAYNDFTSAAIDISTFDNVFDEVKPFIPLCYRDAMIYYSRTLRYEEEANESDIYANIYSWSF